jgi:hypothetical protein
MPLLVAKPKLIGFAFNRNTTVQSPLNMIKEEWFLEAIEDRPDFLCVEPQSDRDSGPVSSVSLATV